MRVKRILYAAVTAGLILVLVLAIAKRRRAKDIQIPFKPVSLFSERVLFCNFHLGIFCIDVSRDEAMYALPYRYEAAPIFPVCFIAVRPDNSRMYVCTKSHLLEFDGSITLIRKIPVAAFGLDSNVHAFSGPAYASNDCLWLTVERHERRAASLTAVEKSLLQWYADTPPETCTKGPKVAGKWSMDTQTGRVFTTRPSCGIYDLESGAFNEQVWGAYTQLDFHKEYGLLLSNDRTSSGGVITRVDLEETSRVELVNGADAHFGCDGYLYFIREDTQLWRCRTDGDDVGPVFLGPSSVGPAAASAGRIMFSTDRRFLAFFYDVPTRNGRQERATVLLDLMTQEYRKLMDGGFPTMGWIKGRGSLVGEEVEPSLEGVIPPFFVELHDAVFFWDKRSVALLLEKGAEVNSRDRQGNTALHYAAEIARRDVVETIIASGADVSLQNTNGLTPLHMAARGAICSYRRPGYPTDRAGTVRALLAGGAETAVENEFGETVLDLALQKGRKDIVKVLVSAGAKLGPRSRYSRMSIHAAVSTGKEEIVEALIASGADVNTQDAEGRTPLEAAWYMGFGMIDLLVEKGADVNTRFTDGYTPLHLAVLRQNERLVRLLLSKAADSSIRTHGLTALDLAKRANGQEAKVFVKLLEEAQVNK
jgi:ankyrin repeat protein